MGYSGGGDHPMIKHIKDELKNRKMKNEEVEQGRGRLMNSHVAYLRPKKSAPSDVKDHFEVPVNSDSKKGARGKFAKIFGSSMAKHYEVVHVKPTVAEEVEQVDEVNARNSFVATQQALTPRAKDVKASVGTTRRDAAVTNKYARRISKLSGGDYSKQDVKGNLKSLAKEEAEQVEEKYENNPLHSMPRPNKAVGLKPSQLAKKPVTAEAADPGETKVVNKAVKTKTAADRMVKIAKSKVNKINMDPKLDNDVKQSSRY
jgi:hypothetical protein